jgi:hypothetical protein
VLGPQGRQELADALASVLALADLRGRAKLYGVRAFAEADPVRRFDEPTSPRLGGPPLPTPEALAARAVAAGIRLDPRAWADRIRAKALTLAATTDEVLTGKIRSVIARAVERGGVYAGPNLLTGAEAVDTLLRAAGVERGGAYARLVFDVAAHEAEIEGTEAAMEEAGSDEYPAWRYDHGEPQTPRPAHAGRDGNYYPARVRFNDVRGDTIEEIAGCTCSKRPVSAAEWQRLQADGARLQTTW